mmetsp:Transcript_65091/g.127798  ORF Transcript_65091/g.127798 Transcript_65091/m.127798 type:complete len:261 (+) Transcript_65091:732-1514(+)
MSASAMTSRSSSWNTPITTCWAPAALVNGPRRLNTLRTPRAFRTGATAFMAGWLTGAYMKPMPHDSTHAPTCSAVRSRLTPRDSRTSADPHALDTLRFPALAVLAPAAAARMAAAVEMLMVSAPSPPVPTMSSILPDTFTGTHARRIPSTNPATSAGDSPFRRSNMSTDATCIGSAPAKIAPQTVVASSFVRDSPFTSFSMKGFRFGAAEALPAAITDGPFTSEVVEVELAASVGRRFKFDATSRLFLKRTPPIFDLDPR